MTKPAPSPTLIPASDPLAGEPVPVAPDQQDLFSEPGSSAPAAEPAVDLGTATDPLAPAMIPKGFRPAFDPPKVGKRVLVILADGQPEFATFEKTPTPSPAVLFSYGYRSRGQAVIVRCWRPIPSNWTE